MELFEITAFLFTGFLGGLAWSAVWGAMSASWALFGLGMFGTIAAVMGLVLIVRTRRWTP